MVTGDCGGVREHGTFGNGSIEEPERSTVVSARSGNERSMLDEWSIPEKGNAAVEVGFAGSTQSAGKLRTRGSGEADEG
jgi:hypothetical protein